MPGIAPGGIDSYFGGAPKQQSPLTSFGNPGSFTAGATTQASDYDTIMKNYDDLAKSYSTNPLTSTNVTPQSVAYAPSADVTKSLSGLSGLSDTGGYTPQGIADIRARDISPTRSIYSSAKQDLERSRSLGGGYSPNFAAASAQMARDESNKIADIDTAANAGIAQNVASNRLAAAGTYAGAASAENAARTGVGEFNTSVDLNAKTGNADRALEAQKTNRTGALAAIQGKTNLYGTTPALTSTFGNQVVQAGQMGQNQQQLNQNKLRDIYGMAGGY